MMVSFRHITLFEITDFLELAKQANVFDKAVFHLGEQQGLLANDECSSRHDRVEEFCVAGLGKEEVNFIL